MHLVVDPLALPNLILTSITSGALSEWVRANRFVTGLRKMKPGPGPMNWGAAKVGCWLLGNVQGTCERPGPPALSRPLKTVARASQIRRPEQRVLEFVCITRTQDLLITPMALTAYVFHFVVKAHKQPQNSFL